MSDLTSLPTPVSFSDGSGRGRDGANETASACIRVLIDTLLNAHALACMHRASGNDEFRRSAAGWLPALESQFASLKRELTGETDGTAANPVGQLLTEIDTLIKEYNPKESDWYFRQTVIRELLLRATALTGGQHV